MNTLKAKTTITCNTCGTKLKRVKSIKVYSDNKNEAIEEANIKIKAVAYKIFQVSWFIF